MSLEPASIRFSRDGDELTYVVDAGDGTRINARARIASTIARTAASRSIYYTSRDHDGRSEVARYDIPVISDAFSLDQSSTSCRVLGVTGIVHDGDQKVLIASFRRMTLVPYLSRGVAA